MQPATPWAWRSDGLAFVHKGQAITSAEEALRVPLSWSVRERVRQPEVSGRRVVEVLGVGQVVTEVELLLRLARPVQGRKQPKALSVVAMVLGAWWRGGWAREVAPRGCRFACCAGRLRPGVAGRWKR